jgi:hypothetical protein
VTLCIVAMAAVELLLYRSGRVTALSPAWAGSCGPARRRMPLIYIPKTGEVKFINGTGSPRREGERSAIR